MDLTPEIEVFNMLFERCRTKNRRRSIKQHRNTSISGVKFSWTTLFSSRSVLGSSFRDLSFLAPNCVYPAQKLQARSKLKAQGGFFNY